MFRFIPKLDDHNGRGGDLVLGKYNDRYQNEISFKQWQYNNNY